MAGIDDTVFDYIIVGGGAAGCVLAARLTENPATSVLLVEAGPDYGPDRADWPEDLRDASGTKTESHSWGHSQVELRKGLPQALPRGRVMGGSSAVNGCIWLHGSAADYDSWGGLGNPGWSFDEILPYFRKLENDPLGGPFHGTDGPVPVYRLPESEASPVQCAVVAAAHRLGFPDVADFNGRAVQEPGIGPNPKNSADGVRMHGAFTYLEPARQRANLTILPDTHIDRIVFEGKRATGITTANGETLRGREIILSAGTFGSPAILLRSGIGPATHLTELGIPVVQDAPGVGEHLLDHPLTSMIGPYTVAKGCEPATTMFVPVLITARSSQSDCEIDLHIYHGQFLDDESGRWKVWVVATVQLAHSQGYVRLTAADPLAPLAIHHNYLADARDMETLCDGVEIAARIFDSPELDRVLDREAGDRVTWKNREELRQLVRESVDTTFHPSSTCRMGPTADPTAVVDHSGLVHGIDGLRVVDASIFPTSPRCNLHGPVLAVAERMVPLIQSNSGTQ